MRKRIRITGAVQGVGFRPHVYRLAEAAGLSGWVLNSEQGVLIEVEGGAAAVEDFERSLREAPPANAVVAGFEAELIGVLGEAGFRVSMSREGGLPAAYLLPDLALCAGCRAELFDPANRRYRYPFITCTDCGPRYSIVEGLPFDRERTTMHEFAMCAACRAEYEDPRDRRFHSQTNGCPQCGPRIEGGEEALAGAARAIAEGRIVAVKGMGGFHLVCDARNGAAVGELRRRKRRPAKPFAVMMEGRGEPLLDTPQAPIVLLEDVAGLAEEVAPGNPLTGVMRAYTPLHALLVEAVGGPIVATSGNLSDEPICIDNDEARARLAAVADLFLVHNRRIARPVDDSLVRVIDGGPALLRRARGYAPLPIASAVEMPEMISTGAHMKNTVAFSRGRRVFVSQHLGDLSTPAALDAHHNAIADLTRTYQIAATSVVCDLHPGYGSSASARRLGLPVRRVQHHAAHLFAVMLEHGLTGPVLGICWDGSGDGGDGTVWGGEYLLWDGARVERFAHLREFSLAGGEQAVREPRRSLYGALRELGRQDLARPLFAEGEWRVMEQAVGRGLNSPRTSSAGRLFDAAAAGLGLCARASFEGEAAMAVEFAARGVETKDEIAFETDWGELVLALTGPSPAAYRAALFHNSLAASMVRVALRAGVEDVALAGGCFQNRLLAERAAAGLRAAGFRLHLAVSLPANDGAIAAGQLYAQALMGGS